MKTKWYSNPYQNEVWESMKQTQKEKDEIDNEIVYALAKIMAFFMALGVIYLLFKK